MPMGIAGKWRGGAAVVVALLSAAMVAPVQAQGWRHVGDVDRVEALADGVVLSSGTARVRVSAFADGVFRVQLAPAGTFDGDASWAVVQPAAPAKVSVDDRRDAVAVS